LCIDSSPTTKEWRVTCYDNNVESIETRSHVVHEFEIVYHEIMIFL
jgi:hypothetical protein